MQSNTQSYAAAEYMSSGMALVGGATSPAQQLGPGPAPAIGTPQQQQQQPFLTTPAVLAPPIPEVISLASEAEAAGELCSVQLPVSSASPSQSAWCSVSNLLAVAFTPEPGSSTARILIVEPSNAEDVTRLELPMAGPGDWITSLEWSWPGQRRALLSATASGRVVVWTQPSQQGQDDSVFPRCIDDWHGQLLLDLGPLAAGNAAAGATATDQQLKQEPGGGRPHVKQEAGYGPDGPGGGCGSGVEHSQRLQPALAGVCWLRQPTAGRSWSTSSLAMKRLDGSGGESQGPGQAAGEGPGGGGGGGPPESFDSLFSDDAAVPGAVPHWARPNQLTAAVLTANGTLTVLWVMASKLPNTLSWYRSKNVRIPPPPEAGTEDGGAADGAAAAAAAAGDTAAASEWRIVGASMCAVHDGSMAAAVVYGRRREAVYLYGMRGNPTLSGQLVTQPCSTAAAGNGGGGGGGGAGGAGRETQLAPPPTVALTARLALPQGLSVRQCRLQLHGGGAARRLYALAVKPPPPPPSSWSHPHPQHPHPQQQPQQAMVFCFSESATEKGAGGWRLERSTQQLLEPYSGGGAAAAIASSSAEAEGPSLDLGISVDGSKLVVPYGSWLYTLDSETLTVLAAKDLEAAADPAPGSLYGNGYGNGGAAPPEATQPAVLAATGCLSSNSCCLCSVVRLGFRNPDGAAAAAAGAAGGCSAMEVDGVDAGGVDGGGDDVVTLSICTVPDVVPPPSGSAAAAAAAGSESIEDTIACNMDTMRLAWGALHRLSVWDVAERLRSAWLAGRTEHVHRSLDQLDGLLYGTEDPICRVALAQHLTRAKLEVLRRLPHPQAALLAADLLASARVLQYSDTLSTVYGAHSDAFSHPETRTVAAHMVWFVLEVLTLMLAGLRLWAESVAADKAQQRAAKAAAAQGGEEGGGGAAAAAGGGGGGGGGAAGGGGGPCLGAEAAALLPLIRLFPDYNLQKHMQAVLFGTGHSSGGGKSGVEARLPSLHPAIQEVLGGPEVASRARVLLTVVNYINKNLQKALIVHTQALAQQAQQNGGGGAGPVPGTRFPGAPVVPLSPADVDAVNKSGELPRPLMQLSLRSLFPGPFHLHYCRSKGIITPAILAQCFRSEDVTKMAPLFTLSREALLERYRLLGLQQQLLDPRQAPHAAARKLWMSFRAPAPPPQLHSHILTQYVSSRQRQRWRRQRGAALALGSSAPLWANAQGPVVDCLTGVPLPPGTSWSLEGAAAVGAVTAQMGPGVGAAAARRNLPPLLAALQRAWVCCAPPAELGSQWKRARLGLEQDLEY